VVSLGKERVRGKGGLIFLYPSSPFATVTGALESSAVRLASN
jgi:hypothetical protein